MGIISWIILGLIAGAIAKLIYPGRQGGGILATMALGIVGAFLGGTLYTFLTTRSLQLVGASLSPGGIVVAVLGAMIAIFIWGLVTKPAS
ncbi:MAG: GlsB/YeaQ/YmgE family stress response membrane protein [Scytolyngbya sp. HA4215-MV1]|jgi:uncharacterized membrane protein YeaQ/YmgE (transglycosylase-associated protein family)|nr:GlsB/YeaQ/YmgE family stress response membrane protein [Scytolyngbya sp. HA4215-MV1]